jgi:hypothetical protein
VVRDLYAGAVTSFRTPGGPTPTLSMDRGTRVLSTDISTLSLHSSTSW